MRTKLLSVIALTFVSGVAFAQAENEMQLESVPSVKRTSVEINPVSALISSVPGVGAVSGTAEGYIGDKFAGYVELGYADIDLKNSWVEDAEEQTNEPVVKKGYGYATAVGLRYYEDIVGSSFYGAGAISYAESKAEWQYEGNDYKSELYTVTPSVSAGYRWVWQNGVLLRLGVGAGMPKVASQNISRANEGGTVEDGRKKIDDLQNQDMIAKVDFGLGYTF